MDLTELLLSERTDGVLFQQRVSALVRLLDVARVLAAEVDLTKILQVIAREACKALVCERATVYQYDPERNELFTKVATELEVSEIRRGLDRGISGYVARHRKMVNVPEPSKDSRWSPAIDHETGFQTRNILAAPLTSPRDGALLGVLECLNNDGGPFDHFDEPLLEAFSQHAAVALDRSRLVDELREHQEIEFALGLARDVQRRFMPDILPAIDGYEVATWWRPNQAVGGDYCDIFPLRDGRLGLVVADVSGHGLGSSLLMASVRAALRSLLMARTDVGHLLELLNSALAADLQDGRFITMIIAAIDLQTHRVEYANAGHAPAEHISASGQCFTALEATGMPIGVLEESDYPLGTPVCLEVGDLILLCTDGIVEAENARGEAFGLERLRSAVQRYAGDSVEELVGKIGRRVEEFCGELSPADDLTVLALRRLR